MAAMAIVFPLAANLHALPIIAVLAPNSDAFTIPISLATKLEAFAFASAAVSAFPPDLDPLSIVVILETSSNALAPGDSRPDDLRNDPGRVDEHDVLGLVELDLG